MAPKHVHGRVHRDCQDPRCREARYRYMKRWKLDRVRGVKRLTDPGQVRLHVLTLLGQGWSARGVAGAAGVAPQTVTRLVRGDAKSIGRATAAKILAVDPDALPAEASHQTAEPFVPRVGTVRRLQALMFMGYSQRDLRGYGISAANLLNQQGRWVTRSTHDKVAAVYAKLAHVPGPTSRSRHEAIKRGYIGPLAWDDIDHDEYPDTDELADYRKQCGTARGYDRHRREGTEACDACRRARNDAYREQLEVAS